MIQLYPEELDYANAKLHPLSGLDKNSFLFHFIAACVHADTENYSLLRPAMKLFMTKYPADPERLAMERKDRGAI